VIRQRAEIDSNVSNFLFRLAKYVLTCDVTENGQIILYSFCDSLMPVQSEKRGGKRPYLFGAYL
jgi:hypothetical protein